MLAGRYLKPPRTILWTPGGCFRRSFCPGEKPPTRKEWIGSCTACPSSTSLLRLARTTKTGSPRAWSSRACNILGAWQTMR
jgi:hypothetical protein